MERRRSQIEHSRMSFSRQMWWWSAGHWAEEAIEDMRNSGIYDLEVIRPFWWFNHEIRMFCERGIDPQTAEIVKEVIEEQSWKLLQFTLRVVLHEQDSGIQQRVQNCMKHGEIDEQEFSRQLCQHSRIRKIRHGDIAIFAKPFFGEDDETILTWGSSNFKYGAMILALYGNRQKETSFLRNLIVHELGHLLGIGYHCDMYKDNIEGYTYDPSCAMHATCPSSNLCPKCRDFIFQWWQAILATPEKAVG